MSLQVTPPDVRCGNNPHTDNTPAARGLTLGLIAELSCNLLDSRVLHAEDRHAELKAGTNPSFQNVPPCSSLWLTAVAVKYRAPGGARRNKTSTGSDPILGGRVTDLWIHWKGQEFSQLTFGQGVLGCAGGHLGDRWCFVGHTHTHSLLHAKWWRARCPKMETVTLMMALLPHVSGPHSLPR